MLQTFLFSKHIEKGAKMVPFAGYSMPVSYTNIKDEYLAVRSDVGMFDVSHMGCIFITSPNRTSLLALLNYVTCRSVDSLEVGNVQYNAVILDNGGILDDITIFRLEDNRYMIVSNASNKNDVYEYLLRYKKELSLSSIVLSLEQNSVLICLQGKNAQQRLLPVLASYTSNSQKISTLYHYQCTVLNGTNGQEYIIGRTGYTGEDGFEILLPQSVAIAFWGQLLDVGIKPCGLASRDLLRLEVFYPLYGAELSQNKTPIESSLERLVDFNKTFIGKDSIQASNSPYRTVGFLCTEEGIPRANYDIAIVKDNTLIVVGKVTSGSFSFQWNAGFGMAYMQVSYIDAESALYVIIREQKKAIQIMKKTPYKGSIMRYKNVK